MSASPSAPQQAALSRRGDGARYGNSRRQRRRNGRSRYCSGTVVCPQIHAVVPTTFPQQATRPAVVTPCSSVVHPDGDIGEGGVHQPGRHGGLQQRGLIPASESGSVPALQQTFRLDHVLSVQDAANVGLAGADCRKGNRFAGPVAGLYGGRRWNSASDV